MALYPLFEANGVLMTVPNPNLHLPTYKLGTDVNVQHVLYTFGKDNYVCTSIYIPLFYIDSSCCLSVTLQQLYQYPESGPSETGILR